MESRKRLIGLRTSQIQEDPFEQMSLFEDESAKKKKEFEKTVDTIRSRFGIDSIKRASFLQKDAIVDHAASKKKTFQTGSTKKNLQK